MAAQDHLQVLVRNEAGEGVKIRSEARTYGAGQYGCWGRLVMSRSDGCESHQGEEGCRVAEQVPTALLQPPQQDAQRAAVTGLAVPEHVGSSSFSA